MPRRRRARRPGALGEFPPAKLLGQIAVMQATLYAVTTPLMLFTALVSGRDFSLDLVFGWSAVRGDTAQGWLTALVWVLSGLFCAVAIVLVVGRSKLVLDFALTLHALHLVIVVLYTGTLPTYLAWWVAMGVSSGVIIAVATWGCRHRELQPIYFGGDGTAGNNATNTSGTVDAGAGSPSRAPTGGDEEQGFVRGGRGRGRGRDGGGEYEMVAIKNGENGRQD